MFRHVWMLLLFMALTLVLGLGSAFDAYLNLKYPVIASAELNPLARWILQSVTDPDHARAIMLSLKFGGTLITIVVLWAFFHFPRTRRWAWIIVVSLTVFQASVLVFMTEGFRFI